MCKKKVYFGEEQNVTQDQFVIILHWEFISDIIRGYPLYTDTFSIIHTGVLIQLYLTDFHVEYINCIRMTRHNIKKEFNEL